MGGGGWRKVILDSWYLMPGYSRRSKKGETQHRLMSDSLSALCMPVALEEEGRVGGRLRVVGKRGGGGGVEGNGKAEIRKRQSS